MAEQLFHIELLGWRDAAGRFARVGGGLGEMRREELRVAGRKTVAALQGEAPVRTGRLKRGIRYRTYQAGNALEMRVTSEAPYTVYVIRGRGPVVARRAKALRFEPGPPGSGFIFRKRVGPAKANPFHKRAFGRLGDEPLDTARRIARRIERAYTIR